MNRITVECDTVTPLFLAGASGTEPEFRAPSLIGGLRFWYRALIGGMLLGDTQAVREKEEGLFGSTKRASKVRVRLSLASRPMVDRNLSSDTIPQGWQNRQGLLYCYFSAKQNKRPFIQPGTQFSVDFSSLDRDGREGVRLFIISFWLFQNFGGIGSRSRRCGGSIQTFKPPEIRMEGKTCLCFSPNASTASELAKFLGTQLTDISHYLGDSVKVSFNTLPEFACLHHDVTEIGVFPNLYDKWEDAVDEVGNQMRNFRSVLSQTGHSSAKNDYVSIVKGYIQSGNLQNQNISISRASFGLPIPFYSRSLRQQKAKHYKATVTAMLSRGSPGDKLERRASPLIFKIAKLATGKHAVIASFFKSLLLPVGADLCITEKGWPTQQVKGPANFSIIEDFWKRLKVIPVTWQTMVLTEKR